VWKWCHCSLYSKWVRLYIWQHSWWDYRWGPKLLNYVLTCIDKLGHGMHVCNQNAIFSVLFLFELDLIKKIYYLSILIIYYCNYTKLVIWLCIAIDHINFFYNKKIYKLFKSDFFYKKIVIRKNMYVFN
jgi:hypothetical protein